MRNFSFKISNEKEGKVIWLVFKNGMISLNALAESKKGIIGARLTEAIEREIRETPELLGGSQNEHG